MSRALQSDNFFFMDSETFEEVMVESSTIEEQKKWISGEFFAAILVYGR